MSVSKSIVLSEDVYWWLVKRKYELRARSLDEVLRIEMPKMTESFEKEQHLTQVKIYSFER